VLRRDSLDQLTDGEAHVEACEFRRLGRDPEFAGELSASVDHALPCHLIDPLRSLRIAAQLDLPSERP
jgi:hypothetical protein